MQIINNYVKKYQQSTGQGAHKSSKDWGGLSKSDNKHRSNHLESLVDDEDLNYKEDDIDNITLITNNTIKKD